MPRTDRADTTGRICEALFTPGAHRPADLAALAHELRIGSGKAGLLLALHLDDLARRGSTLIVQTATDEVR